MSINFNANAEDKQLIKQIAERVSFVSACHNYGDPDIEHRADIEAGFDLLDQMKGGEND